MRTFGSLGGPDSGAWLAAGAGATGAEAALAGAAPGLPTPGLTNPGLGAPGWRVGAAAEGLAPALAAPFGDWADGLGAATGELGFTAEELAGAAWEEVAEPGAAWPGLTRPAASRGRLAASPRGPPKRLGRFLP